MVGKEYNACKCLNAEEDLNTKWRRWGGGAGAKGETLQLAAAFFESVFSQGVGKRDIKQIGN